MVVPSGTRRRLESSPARPSDESHGESDVAWSSLRLSEVVREPGDRLDAASSNMEGRRARETVDTSEWGAIRMGAIARSYTRPRFRRVYVDASANAEPIFQPSQIMDVNPRPRLFLSGRTATDVEMLRVRYGQLLVACSGTIGPLTYVSNTLNGKLFSHDLIRASFRTKSDAGYVYAYLRTDIGRILLCLDNYGAVVRHIEASHFDEIPVPDAPRLLRKRIHDRISRSFELRDRSNAQLAEANELLKEGLNIPDLGRLRPKYLVHEGNAKAYSVSLASLNQRLDATYHVPIVDSILRAIRRSGKAVMCSVGDPDLSEQVILPGRFKRVYVGSGQGVPFFGGGQLHELTPSGIRYLSTARHEDRIATELALQANMVAISCSGTIGKVALVPMHWSGWAASQHIIRVVCRTDEMAAYISVFLSSDLGHTMITRQSYGAVIDEINAQHVASVQIPVLKDTNLQRRIAHLALEANELRTEAHELERSSVRLVDEKVLRVGAM